MTTVQTKVLMPEKKKKVTLAQVILVTIIMLFVLICVLPIINVASVSLSSKSAILRGDVAFLPVEPTINAYKAIVRDASMIRSLFYTIELTVIYTAMAMVMTILLAYPMTKKRLRGRRLLSLFVIFTMYFNGGAIPTYLTIKNYGLINSMWSLILPGLISTYNMIILRSFISALPGELEEAAIIDGATDFQVLLKVILASDAPRHRNPLSVLRGGQMEQLLRRAVLHLLRFPAAIAAEAVQPDQRLHHPGHLRRRGQQR